MKKLLLILLVLLTSINVYCQVQATIKLADGTFINNAPTGRNWTDYKVKGISLQDATDTLIIDDSEQNKVTYYGNWNISDTLKIPTKEGNCYCSFSNNKGDSLIFKFTNADVFEWYGETMSHQGIADIYFDGVFQDSIDTYNSVNKKLTLNWSKDDLDTAKVHVFKLIVTGNKNVNSTGAYIVNQYFRLIKNKVTKPTPPVISPPIIIIPPIVIPPVIIDTIKILPIQYRIIRQGRFKVFIDGVQDDGEHNEYEKAIEHAFRAKALNKDKNVVIIAPPRRIE